MLVDFLARGSRNAIQRFINSQSPHASRNERRHLATQFMQDRPTIRQTLFLRQDELRKNNRKNIERYRGAAKIRSFSERLDSLPMWPTTPIIIIFFA